MMNRVTVTSALDRVPSTRIEAENLIWEAYYYSWYGDKRHAYEIMEAVALYAENPDNFES